MELFNWNIPRERSHLLLQCKVSQWVKGEIAMEMIISVAKEYDWSKLLDAD